MAYGKSIELFLANGTADSLITAELSKLKDGKTCESDPCAQPRTD